MLRVYDRRSWHVGFEGIARQHSGSQGIGAGAFYVKKPHMTPQERDASVDRLLREAITADVRPGPGECLDAETLAAWSDGSLNVAEQSLAEAHASRCVRCQGMLAAMVRTEPLAEASSRSPLFRWVVTLGPAVAAAAALVLFLLVDRQSPAPVVPERHAGTATVQESKSPNAKIVPAPAAPTPSEADNFRAAKTEVAKELDERRADGRVPSFRVGEVAGALKDRDARASAAADAANTAALDRAQGKRKAADRERELMVAESPRAQAAPAAPPAAPVTVTESPSAPSIPPVQTLDQVQASQRQNAVSPSQQAAQQTQIQTQTGVTANEDKVSGFVGSRRPLRAELTLLEVPSPNATFRWRVVDGRTVQLSVDNGKTWATQYTVDTPTAILAGAAPSPSVCWLVGQAGLVLVTKDGRTWQRIKFPEPVDLRRITASDANVASIVTADGRTVTTINAGTTWKF